PRADDARCPLVRYGRERTLVAGDKRPELRQEACEAACAADYTPGVADLIQLTVTRYSPERDEAPRACTYELPYQEYTTVLEGLRQVQARYDDTLSFRWSCAQGKCGTCTVVLNGRPVLSCLTLLEPGPARVDPPR